MARTQDLREGGVTNKGEHKMTKRDYIIWGLGPILFVILMFAAIAAMNRYHPVSFDPMKNEGR